MIRHICEGSYLLKLIMPARLNRSDRLLKTWEIPAIAGITVLLLVIGGNYFTGSRTLKLGVIHER